MSFLSLPPVVSNLANTTLNAVGGNTNAGSGAPSAPVIDLGVSLGSGTSALDLGVQVLNPSAGGSLLGVALDTGAGTSTGASSLDLEGALASLAQALAAPPISTPELSGLSSLVTSVLDAVDAGIDLDIDLGTQDAPVIDLGISLGSSGSVLDLGVKVLNPSAGGSLLDVDLDAGTGTGAAAPGGASSGSADAGAGSATPSDDASELPVLPSLVNTVIEATGLDDLLHVDLGSSATPSTGTPATSGTGASVEAEVTVGSGGVSVGVGVGGSGGSTSTGGTGVPAPSGGTTGGGVSGGIEVSTGSGGGTGTVGTSAETSTGGGHGGSVIHVGHGSGIGTSQAIDLDQRHWMDGSNGNDTIMASNGSDTVYGHDGNDAIFANQSADRIFGGQGDDYLRGGRGDDMVSGGDGDDDIWGDLGDDVLEGGDGADMFYFALNSGHDVILDFNYAQGDRLDFQGQDYSVTEADGAAIVHLSGGGHIALNGVTAAEFNSYAFA